MTAPVTATKADVGLEALPCPFCGGSARLMAEWGAAYVQCDACAATGPHVRWTADQRARDVDDEIIAAWNTRGAEVAELTKANEQLFALGQSNYRDAERYRWLRGHSWLDVSLIKSVLNFGPGYNQTKPEELDAAIDADMARQGQTDCSQTPHQRTAPQELREIAETLDRNGGWRIAALKLIAAAETIDSLKSDAERLDWFDAYLHGEDTGRLADMLSAAYFNNTPIREAIDAMRGQKK